MSDEEKILKEIYISSNLHYQTREQLEYAWEEGRAVITRENALDLAKKVIEIERDAVDYMFSKE